MVTTGRLLRCLIAALVAASVAWSGVLHAVNHSVQGAPKEEGGFDGDAPTAILIETSSGSVLFEKNADELRAPSSMMKLMTAEVVFNAIREGKVKLTDEYRINENAWRRGGAPAGGSTMFAALNSKVSMDDILHGAIIQSGNDACIALAEGMAGNERIFATDFMTKRARELGLMKSTFANSNGLPDPGNKMTVRELSVLARYIMQTYPEFYKLFGEKEFTWNKSRASRVIEEIKKGVGYSVIQNWAFKYYRKLYYYRGDYTYPMIRAEFRTAACARRCAWFLKDPIKTEDWGYITCTPRETNISTIRKFLTVRKLRVTTWFRALCDPVDDSDRISIVKEYMTDWRSVEELKDE